MQRALMLLAAEMLEYAAEDFSNHSCNDYPIADTPDHRALIVEIEKKDLEDIDCDEEGDLVVSNYQLMRYLATQLREEGTPG